MTTATTTAPAVTPTTNTADTEKVRVPRTKDVRNLRIGQAIRQGDVLVQRVRSLPEDCTPRHRRDLAVGVRASHIAEDPAQTYSLANDASIYITSSEPWVLSHDEHDHFVLPAGCYRSWRQHETYVVQDRIAARYVLD